MDPKAYADWIVAIIAGLTSFFSPCILPIIPGYLSMISGLSFEQLEEHQARHRMRIFITCLLFSLGLCVVFIPIGLTASVLGGWLGHRREQINIVFGLVVILFGLFMMGVLKLPFLYQERRLRVSRAATGMWAAPLVGVAFGAGWTPCLGPWIGSLTTVAANLPPARSALLFAVYGAVLGLCFIVTGLLFSRALKAFSFFSRHARAVEIFGGALLVVIGALMASGKWDWAARHVNQLFS